MNTSSHSSSSHSEPVWALVTGASSGIGLELARNLAAAGYHLVLAARGLDKLDLLAEELRTRHVIQVRTLGMDLSAMDAADTIVTQLEQLDIRPAVLVNNAGVGLFGRHADTALEDEQRMIQLNVVTLTRLTKLLLPGLIAQRGKILNLASTAAFQPGPYMAVYYATKAYVLSYSEALAEELADTGVTVTALCPGPTRSGFQDKAAMHDSALVKGKKLPTAKEVADFGLRALLAGRRVAVHGWMNAMMAQSVRLTPRRLVTHFVAQISRPT